MSAAAQPADEHYNKKYNLLQFSVRVITICFRCMSPGEVQNEATLGAQSYQTFSAMLRVNTSLTMKLPRSKTAGADKTLLESCKQMQIEQRLNQVDRGRLLSSSQTTREEWVVALWELDSGNIAYSPAFRVGCLHNVLRSNPTVV